MKKYPELIYVDDESLKDFAILSFDKDLDFMEYLDGRKEAYVAEYKFMGFRTIKLITSMEPLRKSGEKNDK